MTLVAGVDLERLRPGRGPLPARYDIEAATTGMTLRPSRFRIVGSCEAGLHRDRHMPSSPRCVSVSSCTAGRPAGSRGCPAPAEHHAPPRGHRLRRVRAPPPLSAPEPRSSRWVCTARSAALPSPAPSTRREIGRRARSMPYEVFGTPSSRTGRSNSTAAGTARPGRLRRRRGSRSQHTLPARTWWPAPPRTSSLKSTHVYLKST
jgi:hypothetical protein